MLCNVFNCSNFTLWWMLYPSFLWMQIILSLLHREWSMKNSCKNLQSGKERRSQMQAEWFVFESILLPYLKVSSLTVSACYTEIRIMNEFNRKWYNDTISHHPSYFLPVESLVPRAQQVQNPLEPLLLKLAKEFTDSEDLTERYGRLI